MHGQRKYIQREPNSDISTRIKGENNAILKAREEDQTSYFAISEIKFCQKSF